MSNCSHGVWDGACAVCKPIHSPKDQLYHFRYRFKDGWKDIHSKAQFQRHLKARGLVQTTKDDVLKNGQPYQPGPPPAPSLEQVQQAAKPALKTFHQMVKAANGRW